MQKQLKGSLYYLYANSRFSLIVFWVILISLLLVTLIIDLFSNDSTIVFQLSSPTYIFAAIMGYWIVKNTIPYIVKLGGTRASIFVAVGIYAFLLAVFNATIANTLNKVVTFLFGEENMEGVVYSEDGSTMTFNHLADFLTDSTWVSNFIIDISISFFMLVVMFLMGLIFYRYGLVGGISFLAVGAIIFIIGMSKGWLVDFFINIFTTFSIELFYQLFVVAIIIYALSFLLLRRLTV